jgi:transposase
MVGKGEFMDIHQARVEGKSISEIARRTGRDRKTIRRLLEEGGPGPRKPRQVGSKLDSYREYLLGRMLGEDRVLNSEVLYDEIRVHGYTGGRSILKEFIKPFRELGEEKTTQRFETPAGKQAQVDWGHFRKRGCKKVHGFVMTLGWSRAMYLEFSESEVLANFLRNHEQAFQYFGGVPQEILYDRAGTVWVYDDANGQAVFHPGLLDFAEHYGFKPRVCQARRPQTKGKVERGIRYVKGNFWPRIGGYERACGLTALARQWLDETCNVRIHGTTGERPVDRLPHERLQSLEGHPPYRALILERRRVAKDCFLSYAASWYSVPYEYAGREVWVRQTEKELVISYQDQIVATHPLAQKPRQRVVNPDHFRNLAAGRDRRLQWEMEQALAQSKARFPALSGPQVEKRPLSIYEELS